MKIPLLDAHGQASASSMVPPPRWAKLSGMVRPYRLQSWDADRIDFVRDPVTKQRIIDPETQRLAPPPEPSAYATSKSMSAGYNAMWSQQKATEASRLAQQTRSAADAVEGYAHKAELMALQATAAAGVAADIDRVANMVNSLNALLAQAFAHVAPEDYSHEPHTLKLDSSDALQSMSKGDALLLWSPRQTRWLPAVVVETSKTQLKLRYGNPFKQAQVGSDPDGREEAEEREQADLMPELVMARNLKEHADKIAELVRPSFSRIAFTERAVRDPEVCSSCPRSPELVRELEDLKRRIGATWKRIAAVTSRALTEVDMLDPLRRDTVMQTKEVPPVIEPDLLRPDGEPWWPDRPNKQYMQEQVEFDSVLYDRKTGRPFLGRRRIETGTGRLAPSESEHRAPRQLLMRPLQSSFL